MRPRKRWFAPVLDALVPARCALCGFACDAAEPFCGRCARELRRTPTFGEHRIAGLDWTWSAFEHSGVPRQIVAVAKYRARPGLLATGASEMAARLPPLTGQWLVPVPPDPWRHRRRGFDQAAELAERLAALTDFRVTASLRRPHGAPQAGRSRADRLGSRLQVRAVASLPEHPVLVDDVVTTGATLRACAEAARAAGAVTVRAVTLTRKPAPGGRL